MPATRSLETDPSEADSYGGRLPNGGRWTADGRRGEVHTRSRPRGSLYLLATGVMLTALALATAHSMAQGGDAMGVSSGVFTAEQAESGAEVFQSSCSSCHGASLEGGFGPRLAPIGEHWHGSTLGSLYAFVSTAMPFSAPGSLETDQYVDVLAFVLRENGYPAGDEPLIPDEDALDAYVIDVPEAAATPEY